MFFSMQQVYDNAPDGSLYAIISVKDVIGSTLLSYTLCTLGCATG